MPPAAPVAATAILVSASVKLAFVNAFVALLLVIVKVMVDTPPTPIEVGANALAMVGAATAIKLAASPTPVVRPVAATPATVLAYVPAVAPTLIGMVIVQVVKSVIVPPVNE